MDSAICQHLHQLCVIAAVCNDPGKTGHSAEFPDKLCFMFSRGDVQCICFAELFSGPEIIILYEPGFQITKQKVCGTFHIKWIKQHFLDYQLSRFSRQNLDQSGHKFAGEAIEKTGSGFECERGRCCSPNLLAKREVPLFPEWLHSLCHGKRSRMRNRSSADNQLIGKAACHIEDIFYCDRVLGRYLFECSVGFLNDFSGMPKFRKIFV